MERSAKAEQWWPLIPEVGRVMLDKLRPDPSLDVNPVRP
jgi:hypothetical protein